MPAVEDNDVVEVGMVEAVHVEAEEVVVEDVVGGVLVCFGAALEHEVALDEIVELAGVNENATEKDAEEVERCLGFGVNRFGVLGKRTWRLTHLKGLTGVLDSTKFEDESVGGDTGGGGHLRGGGVVLKKSILGKEEFDLAKEFSLYI